MGILFLNNVKVLGVDIVSLPGGSLTGGEGCSAANTNHMLAETGVMAAVEL